MDGFVAEHANDASLGLALRPRASRLNEKVVWVGRHAALRFARLEDAMAFGETFAPGSFRVMPVTALKPVAEEPPAELRVLAADPSDGPTEGDLSEIEVRPARRSGRAKAAEGDETA